MGQQCPVLQTHAVPVAASPGGQSDEEVRRQLRARRRFPAVLAHVREPRRDQRDRRGLQHARWPGLDPASPRILPDLSTGQGRVLEHPAGEGCHPVGRAGDQHQDRALRSQGRGRVHSDAGVRIRHGQKAGEHPDGLRLLEPASALPRHHAGGRTGARGHDAAQRASPCSPEELVGGFMRALRLPEKPRLMLAVALAVLAIIWRLLYTWQGFMNLVWMNAVILSMASGSRQFVRPLGLLILTGSAVALAAALAGALVLFLHVQPQGRRRR